MLDVELVGVPGVCGMVVDFHLLGRRERLKIAEAVRLGIAWNFAHESGGGNYGPRLPR